VVFLVARFALDRVAGFLFAVAFLVLFFALVRFTGLRFATFFFTDFFALGREDALRLTAVFLRAAVFFLGVAFRFFVGILMLDKRSIIVRPRGEIFLLNAYLIIKQFQRYTMSKNVYLGIAPNKKDCVQ